MRFSEEEIKRILAEKIFELTLKRISSEEEVLVDSGILTSITLAELAVEIEKSFSVEVNFMEVTKENFNTLGSITRFVQKKLPA